MNRFRAAARGMRFDGDDPVRLLLVESTQVQANLERPEIDVVERDRLGRDVELGVVDGDTTELLFRRDEFGIELAGARNDVSPATFDRQPQPADLGQQILAVALDALEFVPTRVMPAAALRFPVAAERIGQPPPRRPRRLGRRRGSSVPPIGRFEAERRPPVIGIPDHL